MVNKDLLTLGLRNPKKYQGIVKEGEEKKRKHEESNLQLAFCKWVSKAYPNLDFIRHEREAKRGYVSGSLMKVYNSLDGIPDWECLDGLHGFKSLYIEFKKPGELWLDKHGYIKPVYQHQYECHQKLWDKGKPAFFCNDLLEATRILQNYINGELPKRQSYPTYNRDRMANEFFSK